MRDREAEAVNAPTNRQRLLRAAAEGALRRDSSGWWYLSDTGAAILAGLDAAVASALADERLLEVPAGAQRVRLTEAGRLEGGACGGGHDAA